MKRNGLCYICFVTGHISNNCTINYSCNKCRGKHIISLCLPKSENGETKADENNDKRNDVNVTDKPTESSHTIVPTTAVNFSTESNNVLLQTACAKITNYQFCLIQLVKEVL